MATEGDGLLRCLVCGKRLLRATGSHKCSRRSVASYERRRNREQGERDRIAASQNDEWVLDYMTSESEANQ